MKFRLWIVVVLIILTAVLWLMAKESDVGKDNMEIARNWITEEASTYVYDGNDLTFESEEVVTFGGREAYLYTFIFESRHGGYGDRTGKIVTQVITSHKIEVVIQDGEVISAVTDGVFDELSK